MEKKETNTGKIIGRIGLALVVVCVLTCTVMYLVNSYSYTRKTLTRLITEQLYYDQALLPGKAEEYDILYDHLFRLTKVPPYNEKMSTHDQFLIVRQAEPWELNRLKSFASASLSDMAALGDMCEFSKYFNTVFLCNTNPQKMGITTLEELVVLDDYTQLTYAVTGETFLPARPLPIDTAKMWKQINYKNYTNLQILSEGKQVANIQFPKDSLSAQVATFDILRPSIDFKKVKPRLRKDRYAIATQCILIKDVAMSIHSSEPQIRYGDDGNYTISSPVIMEPVYNQSITYVAYVCTLFYDGRQ